MGGGSGRQFKKRKHKNKTKTTIEVKMHNLYVSIKGKYRTMQLCGIEERQVTNMMETFILRCSFIRYIWIFVRVRTVLVSEIAM